MLSSLPDTVILTVFWVPASGAAKRADPVRRFGVRLANFSLLFPVYVIVISVDAVGYPRRQTADLRAGGGRFDGVAAEGPKAPGSMPKREAPHGQRAFFERTAAGFGITARERAVLELVMQGKDNATIAAALGISEKTVRNHISNLYHKTDTANRVELVQTFEVVV